MRRLITASALVATLLGCGQAASKSDAVATPSAAPAVALNSPVQSADVAPGIPRLSATGVSAVAFAPSGWTVEQQVAGDISRDGVPDLAFVLRKTDPAGIITREGFEPSDINPRILAVALGGPGGLTLAAQTHTLIPTREADGLNMDDPFDGGLSIENGTLSVRIDLFMSTGGGDTGPYTFRFRQQQGAIRLIGYDHANVRRMSGATTELSANLLTGRVTTSTGSIDTDKQTTVVSRTTLTPLPMDEVGDAFSFEDGKLDPAN